MRRLAAVLLVLAAGGVVVPAAESATPLVSLDVRADRPWFGPNDPLALGVIVRSRSDDDLRNLRVSLAIHERARSRSELARAFSARLPVTPLQAFTLRVPDLPRRSSETLAVRQPLDALPGFAGAPSGVYPLTVTVRRSTGTQLAQVVTAITFLDAKPLQPLSVLPVLSLFPPATLGPDAAATGVLQRLERMTQLVSGVPQRPSGAFAVSPVFLDELELLAQGLVTAKEEAGAVRAAAERLRAAIRALAARTGVLRTPYANIELPDAGTGLRSQMTRGDSVLSARTGAAPQQMLYPPGLAVDDRSLTLAADAGVRSAVVPGASLRPGQLTPSRPARVGRLLLLPADAAIADVISQARSSLDVGRALASTAMIYFESPGRRRALALVADLEQGRAPEALAAFARAPWIAPLRPEAAAALDAEPGDVRTSPRSQPPDRFRSTLSDARRSVEGFGAFTLPGNPLGATLQTSLDRARSTADWHGDWERAARWTRRIVRSVDDSLAKITATVGSVTFTSRSGEVPVTVANRNEFPIRLRLTLASPKLRFPDGATRVVPRLDPPGETIAFEALSESTGTFPLTVAVRSPDGSIVLDRRELVVRSTAANLLALVLTVAGAIFLVASYGRRRVRKAASP